MTLPKVGDSAGRVVQVGVDSVTAWAQGVRYALGSFRTPPSFGPPAENHLVLLARPFPPYVSGGVYRPLGLARAAVERGWHTSVVTQPAPKTTTPAGLELARAVPPAVSVKHFSPVRAEPSARLAPGLDGGFATIPAILESTCRILADRPASVVVASGPTFAEFVAGMVLRQAYGMPLVLDYRDEWTECPFDFVSRGRTDRWWERICTRVATRIVFTTTAIQTHHRQVFPTHDGVTSVIPNGWEDYLLDTSVPVRTSGKESRTVFSFFGVLAEHWDLDEFLKTLRETIAATPSLADDLLIRFVGNKGDRERDALHRFPIVDLLEDIDHVPHSEAQQMMRASDVLLTFNSARLARSVGGKSYEYLAAGVPVLVYGRGGEMETLFGQYTGTRLIPRGDHQVLGDALRSFASGRVKQEIVDGQDRAGSERRTIRAHQLVDLLEETVNASTTP